MDTKRFTPESQTKPLLDRLEKYGDMDFSAVITIDDNALNFVLNQGRGLYAGIPLVFCGVNGFDALRQNLPLEATGVVSRINLQDTVSLALELKPILQLFM